VRRLSSRNPPADDVAPPEIRFDEERALWAERFFERLLRHTKGRWAGQLFRLADWQRDEIIRPLFGTVRQGEDGEWTRLFRMAWLELARKNGKSELLAGIGLYLLIADGEEGAEIYGAARDRDQASIVWDVAQRMVELSPYLQGRLRIFRQTKRIVDERTSSFYRVIAADAAGNLGWNPHGVLFDEVLTQPSRDLWDALRTAMGSRTQPLMVAATTAGNDPSSFAAHEHEEMARVAEDPARAPHVFVYMRNTPRDADPWDESKWPHANPALGDFLDIRALREEAVEAHNDPAKENAFRQYRLNQWVQQTTRWIPLHLWEACADGELFPRPDWPDRELAGQAAFGGLDLSSKEDLTALCWFFPDVRNTAVWRFFLPEERLGDLDRLTGGQAAVWAREGWLTLTEGNVIDYEAIYAQVEEDARRYKVTGISADPWLLEPVRQEIGKRTGIEISQVRQTYAGMSEPLKQLMVLVRSGALRHGANPVARFCADSVEVRQDDAENIKPVKPDRGASGRRIDGIVALAMAIDAGILRRPRRRRGAAFF